VNQGEEGISEVYGEDLGIEKEQKKEVERISHFCSIFSQRQRNKRVQGMDSEEYML
jgi:glycerate kinase